MPTPITASMLYDLVQCPHRMTMDLFGDRSRRDSVSPFVELLWERGQAFEKEVIDKLAIPFTNLRPYAAEEKERLTREAISRGDALIYAGRISADDLLGDPDLLRHQDNGYVAGDIKSGAGEEGATEDTEGKPKKHYAVQLALYTDILERLGVSAAPTPFVWDIHGEEVVYDLAATQGTRNPTTLWNIYQECLASARLITAKSEPTLPALISDCKLCHWRTVCRDELERSDDLTLIPELGRAKRDALMPHVRTVEELASLDVGALIRGSKTLIPGVGVDTLKKFQARAQLRKLSDGKPYLREQVSLPGAPIELFFDIETDPMRDICYLHGFVCRRQGETETEQYYSFFATAPNPEEEKKAFADAWSFVSASAPSVIYYYSPYERTIWRKLQQKYPGVISEGEIEALFAPGAAVDLYHGVIRSKTEWPTSDYSVKTLASKLGFSWRDSDPSGAASIEWYHRWTETGDQTIQRRILEYNEDDCRAMRVLLEGVRRLPIRST